MQRAADDVGSPGNAAAARVKLDFTINLPTMLTLCAMAIAGMSSGIRIYSDVNERVIQNTFEINSVKGRVNSLEGTLSAARIELEARGQAVRAELKGELTEIKQDVKSLLVRQASGNQILKEWSR